MWNLKCKTRGLLMPDLAGFVNSYEVGGKIKYGLNGLKMRRRETTLIDGLELN